MENDKVADGTQIVYNAWHIWNVAAEAAQRATEAKAKEAKAMTSDTTSAIILSAVSAEAFINELAHRLDTLASYGRSTIPTESVDWRGIGSILEQLEREHAQVKSKYMVASLLLPGEALQRDRSPCQDFETLIEMRNNFVHPKVQIQSFPAGKHKPPKYFNQFVNRGWTYSDKNDEIQLAGWMQQLETPEMARWACRSAHNVIWNIIERFEGIDLRLIQLLHRQLAFQWRTTVNDLRTSD